MNDALKRDDKGRLLPGTPPGPGRPKGSKNFSTDFDEVVKEIAEQNNITESEARKRLLKKAYAEANEGKYPFYQDIMDRYYGKPPQTIKNEFDDEVSEVKIEIKKNDIKPTSD